VEAVGSLEVLPLACNTLSTSGPSQAYIVRSLPKQVREHSDHIATPGIQVWCSWLRGAAALDDHIATAVRAHPALSPRTPFGPFAPSRFTAGLRFFDFTPMRRAANPVAHRN
jgi:hypothetical protein